MSGEHEVPDNYSKRDLVFTQFHYDLTAIYFSFVRVGGLSPNRLSDFANKPCTSVQRVAPNAGKSPC